MYVIVWCVHLYEKIINEHYTNHTIVCLMNTHAISYCAYSGCPDQTPLSDLSLHCLPLFHKKDVRVIIFLAVEGRGSKYLYKRLSIALIGPQPERHLNGTSLSRRCWPNIECWLGSFLSFQEIQTNIARKAYIFVILGV